MLYAGKRFHIVHDRRLAEESFDGGMWRLDSRPSPAAFDALDQPGFFAANVGRGAAMDDNIQRKAAAENVLA